MRAYNERPSTRRKIRLYGIDLTGGLLEGMNSQAALDAPLAYLDQADPVSAKQLRGRLEPLLGRFSDSGYRTLTVTERDVLTGAIADTVALFERRRFEFFSASPEALYAMAYHEAEVARQVDSRFRSGVSAAPCPASSVAPMPLGARPNDGAGRSDGAKLSVGAGARGCGWARLAVRPLLPCPESHAFGSGAAGQALCANGSLSTFRAGRLYGGIRTHISRGTGRFWPVGEVLLQLIREAWLASSRNFTLKPSRLIFERG